MILLCLITLTLSSILLGYSLHAHAKPEQVDDPSINIDFYNHAFQKGRQSYRDELDMRRHKKRNAVGKFAPKIVAKNTEW